MPGWPRLTESVRRDGQPPRCRFPGSTRGGCTWTCRCTVDGSCPLGLVGASIGALPAQLVMAGHIAQVSAAALVSPVIQLAEVVAANERHFNVTYPWNDASRAVAARFDLVARAAEIAAGDPQPALCWSPESRTSQRSHSRPNGCAPSFSSTTATHRQMTHASSTPRSRTGSTATSVKGASDRGGCDVERCVAGGLEDGEFFVAATARVLTREHRAEERDPVDGHVL